MLGLAVKLPIRSVPRSVSEPLCVSRAHPGGSLWQPAEAAPQPDGLQRVPAAGPGDGLPAEPVPRRGHAREAGHVCQLT